MVIGIEAERANHPQKTGVEHYAQQLILHLAVLDKENKYILYVRTKPQAWFFTLPKNFQVKVMPFPVFWTQLRISWEMLTHPVDVLFIPASSMPIIHAGKTVVTVHDLAFMFFPESYTWFTRNFHRLEDFLVKLFAWKIIAVSQSTKNDLVKFYGIAPGKISVIHHGYRLEDSALPTGSQLAGPLRLPQKPYVLFLSTLQPRKNLERLIEAFRKLKTEQPDLPHKLIVAGKPGWKFSAILESLEKNSDIVAYVDHVSEAEKAAIFKHAEAIIVPSLYEGFGMQILEAFAAGVPVLASNISSMPEVAGDAAVYFDPLDIPDMKNALQCVLSDAVLRAQLREKGFLRLKDFSWDKCARETLKLLTSP